MDWDAIFAKETRWLRVYFRRKRIPPSEAADVIQDVWLRFITLLRRGRFVEGGPPPGPYLNRIAYNVLRERRRSIQRHPPPEPNGIDVEKIGQPIAEATERNDLDVPGCFGDE